MPASGGDEAFPRDACRGGLRPKQTLIDAPAERRAGWTPGRSLATPVGPESALPAYRRSRRLGLQTGRNSRMHQRFAVRIPFAPPSRSAEARSDFRVAEPAANTAADMRPVPYSCGLRGLHVSAVLAADLVEGGGDLSERAAARRVHQHGEQVLVGDGGVAQALQRGRRRFGVAGLEGAQAGELAFLLVLRGALQRRRGFGRRLGVEEDVDADDRIAAVVLHVLVVQRFVLDAAPLIAGLHGAEHAAALGQ